jgi:hypothetical protein
MSNSNGGGKKMDENILKFTKITFAVDAVVSFGMAIFYFLFHMFSNPFVPPLFVGLTVVSLWSIKANQWNEIKIVVIFKLAWLVVSFITTSISFISLFILFSRINPLSFGFIFYISLTILLILFLLSLTLQYRS